MSPLSSALYQNDVVVRVVARVVMERDTSRGRLEEVLRRICWWWRGARTYLVPMEGDNEPTLLGKVKLTGAPVSVTMHPSSSGVDDAHVLVALAEGTVEL